MRLLKHLPVLAAVWIGATQFLSAADSATGRTVLPAIPAGRLVDTNTLARIYAEVKTPFKYDVVIQGASPNEFVDCPGVFRSGDHWYMMYIAISNRVGYQTFLAQSDDLLHWQKLGKILSLQAADTWDRFQSAGGLSLADYHWDGTHTLEKFAGKYWLSYIGGAKPGYETDPLSIGMAWTENPAEVKEWNRSAENPVLSPAQPDVRAYEAKTLYKSQIIHDAAESLGWPFVMYYNGHFKAGYEQIGMAVSRDMVHWQRYGTESVIANGQAQKRIDPAHPFGIALGEIIIDRHHMHTLARQCIEITGQGRHQGFALAGAHFRNRALMQHHAADELHVKMPLAKHTLGSLAHSGKGRNEQIVKFCACGQLGAEFSGAGAQSLVA